MDVLSKLQFVIDIKPMKPTINSVMDMEKLIPLKGLSIQGNKSDDIRRKSTRDRESCANVTKAISTLPRYFYTLFRL